MKRAFSLILIGVILLSLTCCGGKSALQKYTDYCFDYFDTVTTIVGYADTKEEFDGICLEIKNLISEYHRLFDIYNTYDGVINLATVNRLYDGKHKEFTVDKKIIDLILFSKQIYSLTSGKTNIAMGSVLSIWHNYRSEGISNPEKAKLPPIYELNLAAEHTNINNVIVDQKRSTVYLADDKMTLDVGAVAKGYTVEKIYEHLKQKNISGYIINLGGNIKTLGTHQNGEEFLVGIENPDQAGSEQPYISYLTLRDKALVTSGSYQRYYTVSDKNYHHIINPETLMPSEEWRLVSVLCEDSAVGDALSTALFCMDHESGLSLVNSLNNTEVLWLKNDGTKFMTEGFKAAEKQ